METSQNVNTVTAYSISSLNLPSDLLCSENEVDGLAFLNLTELDVSAMFPGKVGISRKLIMLIKTHDLSAQQVE